MAFARLLRLLLPFVTLGMTPTAWAVSIDWVTVGDPGNGCDPQPGDLPGCFGTMDTTYRIAKYETTNRQYAEFLNAKATADPLALYSIIMASESGGITRSGSSPNFTYDTIPGREDLPVNHVSFYDALRFANWLHNGQGNGDTETGAYTLLGGAPEPSNGSTVARNAEAAIFVASESEWYKAAYYDADTASYFDYPAGTDAQIVCAAPGATPNTANCDAPGPNDTDADVDELTIVGSFTGSASPYGTFDQAGNLREWNETIISGSFRGRRGGSFLDFPDEFRASDREGALPSVELSGVGFRVASIPEPGTGLLLATGLAGVTALRRGRDRPTPSC